MLDPWQRLVLQHALGERDDGRWAAFEVALIVSRQNGKGAILEALALAGLFLFGERLILHSAHEYRTAMEAYRRVLWLLENTDDLRRRVKKVVNTNGEEGVELRSGQRLRFIARTRAAGRGFSADRLIWDEAYALTEDQVEAQMPVLSARPNAQIWYTSSPPLDPVTGAQLFSVRRRVASGNPGALAYLEWGAGGQLDKLHELDLDDPALWMAANPAFGHRITEDTIRRERAAMSARGFARERLCVWPPDFTAGYQVISSADWQACADPASVIHGARAFAVDASMDGKRAAISVAGRRADGLEHVELVDARAGTRWVARRLRQLSDRWQPCNVVVDPGGPAGSLIGDIEAAGVEVNTMTTRDVCQAYGQFVDRVCGSDEAGRTLRHIGQPELTAAVAGAARRLVGDRYAWDRRQTTADMTPVISGTNALHGYLLRANAPTVTPWAAYA